MGVVGKDTYQYAQQEGTKFKMSNRERFKLDTNLTITLLARLGLLPLQSFVAAASHQLVPSRRAHNHPFLAVACIVKCNAAKVGHGITYQYPFAASCATLISSATVLQPPEGQQFAVCLQ